MNLKFGHFAFFASFSLETWPFFSASNPTSLNLFLAFQTFPRLFFMVKDSNENLVPLRFPNFSVRGPTPMHTMCGPGAWPLIQYIDSDFVLILSSSRYRAYWLGLTPIIPLFVKFTDPCLSTAYKCVEHRRRQKRDKRKWEKSPVWVKVNSSQNTRVHEDKHIHCPK